MYLKHTIFPELRLLNDLKQQKVTFILSQDHWQSCHSTGYTWFPESRKTVVVLAAVHFLLVFHCNYISVLHHFRDTIDYFPELKEVTWLWLYPHQGFFAIAG